MARSPVWNTEKIVIACLFKSLHFDHPATQYQMRTTTMTSFLDRQQHELADTHGEVEYGEVETPVLIIGAWAAGGINASFGNLDSEDNWLIHAADTFNEEHSINDPTAVETVCRTIPDRIRELDEWGCDFNRTDDGDINQHYFGAQAYRRTCYIGDRTGEAILETLVDRAEDLDVPYQEDVLITKLLSDGDRVYGAAGYDMNDGHFVLYDAEFVVLAAGGFTAMYKRHTSRENENTADGPALALDAGAELMDTEFVQFHPTGMTAPEGIGEE
jgi:succinate dehydrogenase / fumarate reductase flavoprotein subunit